MSKKKNRNKKKGTSKKKTTPQREEDLYESIHADEISKDSIRGVHDFWFNQKLHLGLIFLISIGIYLNTFSHQYAVDDSIVILRNNYTKKGLKGMKGIWTEDTFTGFFGQRKNLVAGGRYRPLSVATFALELQLFGTPIKDSQGNLVLDKDGDVNYQGSPFLSHFINVLLYALLCVVIYLMLLQMFNPKDDKDDLKGYFIALAGALLYATHPIHTEAVANIKGRDEIMVLLGAVLATYWTLKAVLKEDKRYWIAGILAFIFAIFSKENAITFLAIIPAAIYFFTEKKEGEDQVATILTYTAPFLVITLGFWFGIRGVILGEAAAVSTAPAVELMNDPFLKIENGKYVSYTASERVATVLYTWLEYIKLLIYPGTLTNDYYPKHIRTNEDIIPTFQSAWVLLSVLIHLALVGLTILGTLRRKPYAFFLLFYFATFSVVSNLLFPIGTNMAERFMFLPSVGYSALCAMGLYYIIERGLYNRKGLQQSMQIPTAILFIVVGLYSYKTFDRNFAWKDDYTLFTTDIVNSPHSAKLNNAVSGVLQDKSRTMEYLQDDYKRKEILERSLGHSKTATDLHPTYNNAWLLQGNANVLLGNMNEKIGAKINTPKDKQQLFQTALNHYDQAIACYQMVQKLRPNHPDVQRNLGVTYRDKGKLLGQYMGRNQASINSLMQSLQYRANDTETLRLLGVANGMQGVGLQNQQRYEEATKSHLKAIEYFNKALELSPNNVPIIYNLEIAYSVLNLPEKAAEYKAKRMEIDPNYDPRNAAQQPKGAGIAPVTDDVEYQAPVIGPEKNTIEKK